MKSLRDSLSAAALVSCLLTLGTGCNSPSAPSPPPSGALFQVRACKGSTTAPSGEIFRVLLQDSALIAQASSLLVAGGPHIVAGQLRADAGGYNLPWSWHLESPTITFPSVAAEVCDGCPSAVEGNLAYWLQLGVFCPWTAEVVARDQ